MEIVEHEQRVVTDRVRHGFEESVAAGVNRRGAELRKQAGQLRRVADGVRAAAVKVAQGFAERLERRQRFLVATAIQDAARRQPLRDGTDERRLPDPGLARDQNQPRAAAGIDEAQDLGELAVAADEQLVRARPRRRVLDKRRILGEDRALQVAQRRAGLQPELLREPSTHRPISGERVSLAFRPVQSQHQLALQALAQRIRPGQLLELGHQRVVPASGEIRVEPGLQRVQALLLKPSDRGLRERLGGDVGQRRATPQLQGRAQVRPRLVGS